MATNSRKRAQGVAYFRSVRGVNLSIPLISFRKFMPLGEEGLLRHTVKHYIPLNYGSATDFSGRDL